MQLAFARFESQQLTVSRFDYIVRQNWNVIFFKKTTTQFNKNE